MTNIKLFAEQDWPQVWRMIEPVLRAGDTYAYPTDITEDQAYTAWIQAPLATYVAVDQSSDIVGIYYLKTNQPGQGSHVCNCGYIVAAQTRGKGLGAALCRHSQAEAVSRGFRAMQFNLVVSTNEPAVRLWLSLGFEIVGSLPKAFNHARLGFVDAFIMFKALV